MRTSALLLDTRPAAQAFHHFWLDAGDRRAQRVLMIEDDPTIAAMYTHQLRADGYQVELAADGPSGIHMVQSNAPDIVLLDVRLPKLSGLEVLTAMARDPRVAGVPVLVLSNYSDAAIVREAKSLGARDYLVKAQTTPAELVEKIRQHLPAGP